MLSLFMAELLGLAVIIVFGVGYLRKKLKWELMKNKKISIIIRIKYLPQPEEWSRNQTYHKCNKHSANEQCHPYTNRFEDMTLYELAQPWDEKRQ